jgi:FMN-dependent NADH-azoreductase
MTKLLHLASSPRGERSHTLRAAGEFIRSYQNAHPHAEVATIDLWAYPLPRFDGDTIAAKYAVLAGEAQTPGQDGAWEVVRGVVDQFKSADALLLSVPMWNFGVPYVLKHYIDVVTQPGLTFAWSPTRGFEGLVTGRPAVIISASAGAYPAGTDAVAADFERPYLEHWLRFVGFTDIRTVAVAPTLGEPAAVVAAQLAANGDAAALAAA